MRRYATSKGGLKTLTNALAVELGPLGIRVNAVRDAWQHRLAVASLRVITAWHAGSPGRYQHADASRRL